MVFKFSILKSILKDLSVPIELFRGGSRIKKLSVP